MVAMITTESLVHIDINPLALDSELLIEALVRSEYKERQSSYSAHREALRRRRKAVRVNARPWRR